MPSEFRVFYVEDVCKTVAFYQKALEASWQAIDENGRYAEMVIGDKIIAFASVPSSIYPLSIKESFIEADLGLKNIVQLLSDDVAVVFEAIMSAGGTPVVEPTRRTSGSMIAFARDPNSVLIEITEHRDDTLQVARNYVNL